MVHEDIFYKPLKGETSGLPHDPFKSLVIPRPIGWISTKSQAGKDNLAPFSQFTNVSFDPPTILWVSVWTDRTPISYLYFVSFVGHQDLFKNRARDTVMNCIETNEFVWNMATYVPEIILVKYLLTRCSRHELREEVNKTAKETYEDEFEEFGIKKVPSKLVRPPRVADSPVSFECRVHSIVRIANDFHGTSAAGPHMVGNSDIVIGRVIGIHIKGEYITPDGVGWLGTLPANNS